jgi:IS4 transposase
MFDSVLRRFMEEAPVCVAVRATLERLLRPEWLDALFHRSACHQYEEKLLFSTAARLMGEVVCGSRRSVHEAYQHADEVGVSLTAVYNKLNKLESQIVAALVHDSAVEVGRVLEHMPLPAPLLEGYELRIVDGNHLAATEHRLKELRASRSGPLPGQSLVVLDPRRKLMRDLVPCEDGHAQERSLVKHLLALVAAGEVWMADRNFCTTAMLRGIIDRKAFFLIRQHASTLHWEPLGPWRRCGRTDAGRIFEQPVRVRLDEATDTWVTVRRVKLELNTPTRDGEREIVLLSNLPPQAASAAKPALLYRDRWQIEGAFGELTASLRCEINTLGYPRAALFAFGLAVLAYNAVSLVKTAMAAAHGQEEIERTISFYQLAREMAVTMRGMEVAVVPEQWEIFRAMSPRRFAQALVSLAKRMNLRRYRKHPRGPKKPRPPRTHGRRIKHVSTARILARRKPNSARP